ncbi:MAG: orotate phosphoribosyltransferase [Actinomycetota bacterium]|nr:orotate phosphoribosyltransferase [Actinomycetota bacterium]
MIKIVQQNTKLDLLSILKETGAIMEGHFKLTSGFHSQHYLQCAKLLQYPDKTYKIVKEIPDIIGKDICSSTQTIISPAIGGILFGYMVAYEMGKKMIFAERKKDKMEIRRGFEISEGENLIIAEDVITTGGSVKEIIDICAEKKANIKAVVSIVNRSENADFNEVPFFYLIKFDIDKYAPSDCPLCKNNVELDYPGSKKNN